MKLLVIGLDCAVPDLLLGDPHLANLRHLMQMGCYGRLESVLPPVRVPVWMCMATSLDPGTLGVYGLCNRTDYRYHAQSAATSRSIHNLAIWDQVARQGKCAHLIAVPPNYPPRKTSGCSIGCFLTPDTPLRDYTCPPELAHEVRRLVGDYVVDVRGFRTGAKGWLKDEIYAMTRQHFQVVRHILQRSPWDFLQFLEIGLDRMQQGFWKYHDPQHPHHVPDSPFREAVRDYYRYLDEEIGLLLELLDEETAVLVLSSHGAQRLEGGFCVNEWLIQEGLLVVNRYPEKPTPLWDLDVDWERTSAWGVGGYCARIFLNVRGREPRGRIDAEDYDRIRNDLKARLEAIEGPDGKHLGPRILRPEEIYRQVRNIAPDLIASFGDLYWRSMGKVGYRTLYLQDDRTELDECSHSRHGTFILAVPGGSLLGELEDVHLLDLAPTLLEIGGYAPLPEAQGESLLTRPHQRLRAEEEMSGGELEIIRQRLSGLGYL